MTNSEDPDKRTYNLILEEQSNLGLNCMLELIVLTDGSRKTEVMFRLA